MPIRNPTFSEASAAAGLARYWALSSFVRAERIAGFGPPPERGVEDFERWSSLTLALEQTERLFFDAGREGFEDFAEGFGTDTYVLGFEDVQNERSLFDAEPSEAFERGFANDVLRLRWADVEAVSARFSGGRMEDFERWLKNDPFAWSLSSVVTVAVRFGGSAAETFETTWSEEDARQGGSQG